VDLAIEASGWSPCRSKRGVVIFRDGNVVSHGHNFKPEGFACDGSEVCKATCRAEAVHAEQDALMAADWGARGAELLHVKSVDGALVASGGPSCVQCSKLILACGVAGIWLYHADGWQRYDATEFHRLSLAAEARAGQEPRHER
jgi:deoxycytidylate deaminase